MKLKEFTPELTKKAVQGAEAGARAMVGMHNRLDAKMANTPSIANTQQYKDYKKGNQQRKIKAMKQGMPYGRQDGPGTGANAVQGGALKPIAGLKFENEKTDEGWSKKYKKSIDCSNPKGFSQKAHCAGKKKKKKTEAISPMPQTPQEMEKDQQAQERYKRHIKRKQRLEKLKKIQKDLEKYMPDEPKSIEIDPEKQDVVAQVKELKIEKPDSVDTKGMKRVEMPQIHKNDYNEFIDYLKDNGAEFTKQTMPAKQLKATQGEFSDKGVMKQIDKQLRGEPRKPVIASQDNFIIDGHHRWLVAWNTKDTLEVFKVNIDADDLLKLVKNFPKTTYKDIYTEELYDFDKDKPMQSTVAVPGYGTMSIDGLMKNLVQSATELLDRMKQGTDGMRFADYQLNNNKVFLTKLSALIDALDGLQAIRKQGGARSRNIQKEQEEEQQELPVDTDKVFRYIQQLESGQNIQPEDADLMRRGIQSLTANRQTLNPQAILQLLTILT